MAFTKAVKGNKPLRLVIGGPSGSGKSKTALIFADYLATLTNKPTAGIDTEHGRLSLYADEFDFDVEEMEPPFHPDRLVEGIHRAEDSGYGQLVIDSSTHFYAGTGGLLEIVQESAKQKFGGNQYYAWAVGTPLHNKVVDTIIRSPLHVIITSRSKERYLEQEKNGKKSYEKAGEEMIQKSGLEYEFDFCLMMDMEHTARVSKGLNEVDTSVYFKEPGIGAIQKIMDALSKSAVDLPKRSELEESIMVLVKSLGGSKNDELMSLIREYHPSGNFKSIGSIALLMELKDKLVVFDKENK